MSKQTSLQATHTAWCSYGHNVEGHAGYIQSNQHRWQSIVDFIMAIESSGWQYKYKSDDWLCPACAKESGND